MPAKTLLFDIETAPNLAYVWGKWEQNVIAYEEHWYIISFAYKWLGGRKVHSVSLPDFEDYAEDKHNDRYLCESLWRLFEQADIVVGHNSDNFDIKKSHARFLQHQLPPHAPFQSIDTRKIARRYFRFDSNKLDDLGEALGVGRKIKHEGFEALWLGCIKDDDPKAWEKMTAYNRQDVSLLEKVYNRMKPYMENHPNLGLYDNPQQLEVCPNCGSKNIHKAGTRVTRVNIQQRWNCRNCGAWSKSPLAKGVIR